MSSPPHVFWLTGLSGSGKTTMAERMVEYLRARDCSPVLLDGDVIRDLLLEPAGHDRESRRNIARFNGRLCRFLSLQGCTVVCPTISMFHEVQKWNRENIPGYVEIFLDAPLAVLRGRDPKKIYQGFDRDEISDVVGLDIVAESPENPDLQIDMSATPAVDETWSIIEQFLGRYFEQTDQVE